VETAALMPTVRTWVWILGVTTVFVYGLSVVLAYRLVRVQSSYHRWTEAWTYMTFAVILLSVQRLLTVLTAPRTLIYRDLIALMVSLFLLAATWRLWQIFRPRRPLPPPQEQG
jgi:hypothetical protein